jgi:hypothetical protein
MSNKLSAVLILCMSTVCLSACDLIRVAGPCYGVGCPSGTEGRNGQYKPGEAPKAQNAAAPAPAQSTAAPSLTASTTAQPNIVQPGAPAAVQSPAQSASGLTSAQSEATKTPAESTSPQRTTAPAPSAPTAAAQPAQDASGESKPSPFHAIGEFFARLIPHHSSGANPGAASGAGN